MEEQNIVNCVYRKGPNVVFRQIGDEALLIPVANDVGDLSNIYNLNEVGTRIWEFIDGERDVMEICKMIAGEYEAPMDVVINDTSAFISNLNNIKFIQDTYDKKY
ncbi:MAG: PqqD family protein [Nitrospirae bacterium]|nr:PqqD family protein [Nitrospirota bacterium]